MTTRSRTAKLSRARCRLVESTLLPETIDLFRALTSLGVSPNVSATDPVVQVEDPEEEQAGQACVTESEPLEWSRVYDEELASAFQGY